MNPKCVALVTNVCKYSLEEELKLLNCSVTAVSGYYSVLTHQSGAEEKVEETGTTTTATAPV